LFDQFVIHRYCLSINCKCTCQQFAGFYSYCLKWIFVGFDYPLDVQIDINLSVQAWQ
jgi:hypothetical protein